MEVPPHPASRRESPLRGKRLLVTGAAGFIGTALCRKLLGVGAQVVGVDIVPQECFVVEGEGAENYEFCRGDIADPEILRTTLAGTTVVFNLAGKCGHLASMEEPLADLHSNGVAQLALLEGCRRWALDAHVIFASTRQVYGRVGEVPVNESHPPSPVDVNGVNKLGAELLHLLYSRRYGLCATVLRLTNTYGPGMNIHQPGRSFLGEWLRTLLRAEPLTVLGSGDQLRDLNHVEDVVDAFVRTAEAGRLVDRQVFNLGGVRPFSLNELAHKIVALTHGAARWRRRPFSAPMHAIDIGDYWGDYRKIRSALGWEPRTDLEEGLRQVLEYSGVLTGGGSATGSVCAADGSSLW